MNRSRVTDYEVRLRISGWCAGFGNSLARGIRTAVLKGGYPEGQVEVLDVREARQEHLIIHRQPTREDIVPLSGLYLSLPEEFQTATTLDSLAALYHRELASLRKSVEEEGCEAGVIEMQPWQRSGSHWLSFFQSSDAVAPGCGGSECGDGKGGQTRNRRTGWAGCGGAIVLDERDGSVTSRRLGPLFP